MTNRRTILKQAIACTLPSIPALSAMPNDPLQDRWYLEEIDQAYDTARNLCWSKETEEAWLQFLGTGLKSLDTRVPNRDLTEELIAWCDKISASLEERTFFRMETSSFHHKKTMVTNLVGAIRQEKTDEEKVIHCLDLVRLISPIHHFQEKDYFDRGEPMGLFDKLVRLQRYYPEVFEQLAQATASQDHLKLNEALAGWSNQFEETEKQEVLIQMNEGFSLLRGEPITA
ncbi:MAG: hypothetical protein QE279_07455 [Rhodoferax sp.]|nr:hypothetical protein [Rhodoferax sp.]